MGSRILLGLLGVAALVVAACGGGDDDGQSSGIRTHKGLAVAAIGQNLPGGAAEGDQAGEEMAAPSIQRQTGAPALASDADRSVSSGQPGYFPTSPGLQQSSDGITVQGYGSASADADSAIVEFYFSTNSPVAEGRAEPGFSGSGGAAEPAPAPDVQQQEVDPIDEADLQAVIDAIVGAGVSRDDVDFIGQGYFDKFFSSATLRATVKDVNAVDGIVQAATNASSGLGAVVLNSTNVAYTLNDCTALEEAAMQAAVEDANERAAVFARTLGVGIGAVEGASNYSYFGGTPCDPGFYPGPYPLGGVPFTQGQPRQVQVFANIAVTFAIQ